MICKVKAIIELDGVDTEEFKSMPQSVEDDFKLKEIAEKFRQELFLNIDSAKITILTSEQEKETNTNDKD